MTKNLLFGYNANNPNTTTLTLNSTTSNVPSNQQPIIVYDLVNYGSANNYCYGDYDANSQIGIGSGYTYPCFHSGVDDNNNPTVWYNYAAASAGTITGTDNTTEASYSICPVGWRLPTNSERDTIIRYTTQFSPVYGGYYSNGTLTSATKSGVWWSSTARGGPLRYEFSHYSGSLYTGSSSRYHGFYIRCIRSL